MIEVTCFQCRTRVRISPAVYTCPKCEQDLRQLLSQEQVSGHFYNRASALAANGEYQAALEEVEVGLTYYGSSELHLLAAILSQQLGRYDQMRHHVAAIPLEDSLRSEAEWLLRSHEDRQRALREGLRVDRNVRRGGIQANRAIMVDALSGRAPGSTPAAVRRAGLLRLFAVGSVVLFSLIILVVAATELFPDQTQGLWDLVTFAERTDPDATTDTEDADADTAAPDADPLAALANQTPAPIAGLQRLAPDAPGLSALLREADRSDLLDLGLTVQVENGQAFVQGVVGMDEQRRALAEILPRAPEISQVDLSAVELDPIAVYTVQSGDTLWMVVYNIYGDVTRLDEVAAANRDILPSPEALQPGMELRIP
ncbi:MAG: LysM peptidoglycan-binding domain-containing protein [Litorilinea sp.]